eukprot:c9995_g1_i1 orf=136-324(+)
MFKLVMWMCMSSFRLAAYTKRAFCHSSYFFIMRALSFGYIEASYMHRCQTHKQMWHTHTHTH